MMDLQRFDDHVLDVELEVSRQGSNRNNRALGRIGDMHEVMLPVVLRQLILHMPVVPGFNAVSVCVVENFSSVLRGHPVYRQNLSCFSHGGGKVVSKAVVVP